MWRAAKSSSRCIILAERKFVGYQQIIHDGEKQIKRHENNYKDNKIKYKLENKINWRNIQHYRLQGSSRRGTEVLH